MVKMYKLVSQDKTTHGGMPWEIGKTNKATAEGNKLCTNQVLHCYASPLQAIFLNPIHTNINNPILFEIDCSEIINSDGLKYASKEQTPVKELTLPELSLLQKVAIGIKVALLVYRNDAFITWASNWLSGVDRSATSAAYAAYAAANAAKAANATKTYTNAAYAAANANFGGMLQAVIEWAIDNID